MRHFSDAALPRGILPWQKLIMAYILGIWSIKYPWAGLSALVIILLLLPFKTYRQSLVIPGVFLLGFALALIRLPGPAGQIPMEIEDGDRVVVSGQVESVDFLPDQRHRIIMGSLVLGRDEQARALPGRLVWVWQDPAAKVFRGQMIQAHLKVRPIHGMANFGVWNSEFFWRTQNVLWRSYVRGEHFWHKIEGDPGPSSGLRELLKERTISGFDLAGLDLDRKKQVQGLGLALFFGDRSLLDPSLVNSIRLSSLAHTLALSGLHLGIMAGMGFVLAGFMGLVHPRIYLCLPFIKLGIVLAAPLCLIYIWMGQAPPTLVRSAIMFASWGVFLFTDNRRVLLDGLFLAAGIITLFDPWSVFDLRLQLSAAAVAGIAMVVPVLESGSKKLGRLNNSKTFKYFLGLAAVTLAANLALLPVQAWTFNYISPHLYLNLIWLPVLGLMALPAGFAGLFISFVPGLKWLGSLLFMISGHILNYFIIILDYLHHKDLLNPIITYRPPWQHILAFWVVLVLIICHEKINFRSRPALLGLVLIAVLLIFPPAHNYFQQDLQLRILDVGQGQGIVLEVPGNKRVLVDGGGSWNPEFDLGRQVIVPSLTWRRWPEKLDMVILSHAHVDHYGGLLYPLNHLGAKIYLHNGTWPGETDRQRLENALSRRNTAHRVLARGEALDLGPGLTLEVLHPADLSVFDKLNDTSLVLRLVRNGQGLALIPGDIEAQGIKALLDSGLDIRAQVLVLPHHGSRTSAVREFYSRVSPETAVVSRGFMNRHGLPHDQVTDILSEAGIVLYDTAVHGEVILAWKNNKDTPLISWARSKVRPGGIPGWF